MASSNDNVSMALFCDFENVALGVRDANYDRFDIKPVLERLLLKGSIVVKKAYCDWDRYKAFKAPMHEANFELIEIPHVRQSGKNSADIRMVVDALDLCYTKSHVDTFVIISGDSDFSPLVSKLRENAKKVIGVGVKQSTSDLLVANCDEFIFYDDLVRESRRNAAARRDPREAAPAPKRSPEEEKKKREEMDKRRDQAVEIAVGTFEALVSERGDSGKIWASVLKEAIKRRKPDFSESYYGFRTFGNLIEEAKARGLLEFGRDEKSGAYVYRSAGTAGGDAPAPQEGVTAAEVFDLKPEARPERQEGKFEPRRGRGRGGRSQAERYAERQERNAEREQAAAAAPFEPVADLANLSDLADLVDDADARADAEAILARDSREQQPEALQSYDDDEAQAEATSDGRRGRNNRGRKQSDRQGAERNGGNRHGGQRGTLEPVVLEAAVDLAPTHDAPAEPVVVDLDAMDEAEALADAQSLQPEAPVAKRPRNSKLPARKAKAAAKTINKANLQPVSEPVVAQHAEPAAQPDRGPYGKPSTAASGEPSVEPVADQPVAEPAGKPARKPAAAAKPANKPANKPSSKAANKAAGKAQAGAAPAGEPADAPVAVVAPAVEVAALPAAADQPAEAKAKPARKPAPRRKPKASSDA